MELILGVRAHDYGKQAVGNLLRRIADDGWQAVQLAFPKAVAGVDAFSDVSPTLLEETRAALNQTGLSTAVLGVYVDPSLVDESLRKAHARILLNALPQAKELGAICVGTETTALHSQPGVARDDALRALYRSLEEILPEAERLGVPLAVEPVHCHTLGTPELARALLRDIPSPRLKIIFDPVNLLRLEEIENQASLWARCLDCFGPSIVAVHIKGAARATDENGMLRDAPFASSVVDWPSLFAHLRQLSAPVLRELAVPSEAKSDIDFLRSVWAG